MMKGVGLRFAMTLIELIFAIVIIGVSIMTIPSMMSMANASSKFKTIDEDIVSRLAGWTLDKFQARWDGNYSASGSPVISINDVNDLELLCDVRNGVWYRDNNESSVECNSSAASFVAVGILNGTTAYSDGNTSLGIERLNNGTETLSISSGNITYDINATYKVTYVESNGTTAANIFSTTWILGASGNTHPAESGVETNLKRVVTTFYDEELDVNTTLTFFKSNKGN